MLFIDTEENLNDLPRLRALGENALDLACMDGDFSLSLNFVPLEEMRRLNREFRKVDSGTDVLSFPMIEFKRAQYSAQCTVHSAQLSDQFALELDENGNVFLGDIVMCPEVLVRQAAEYGHSAERETEYLFVHALLHLVGFDHSTDAEKKEMRAIEKEVLKEII